jgi:hypothetical protein
LNNSRAASFSWFNSPFKPSQAGHFHLGTQPKQLASLYCFDAPKI